MVLMGIILNNALSYDLLAYMCGFEKRKNKLEVKNTKLEYV